MLTRIPLFITILLFSAQVVNASNSCRAIFVTDGAIEENGAQSSTVSKPTAVFKHKMSQNEISALSIPQQLIIEHTRIDSNANLWRLHPEDSYISVQLNPDAQSPIHRQKFFKNVLLDIQKELYGREPVNKIFAEKSNNPFLQSILLKSEEGHWSKYTDISFFFENKQISFVDFNVKYRLGQKIGYDEWSQMLTYLDFISNIYSERLSLKPECSVPLSLTGLVSDTLTT
jgi:cell division protein FtsL